MKKQILGVVKAHGFVESPKKLEELEMRLLALADSDMQVNVLRYPVKLQSLDRWRRTVREIAIALQANRVGIKSFQKDLAKVIKRA